jgi:hypothetical protein
MADESICEAPEPDFQNEGTKDPKIHNPMNLLQENFASTTLLDSDIDETPVLEACPQTLTVFEQTESAESHQDGQSNKRRDNAQHSESDRETCNEQDGLPKPPPQPRRVGKLFSKVRLAIRTQRGLTRSSENDNEEEDANMTPSKKKAKAPAGRMQRAARRLKVVNQFAGRDAIFDRIRKEGVRMVEEGGGETAEARASLRSLLASDLPLHELVLLSFDPARLAAELRRIRAEQTKTKPR